MSKLVQMHLQSDTLARLDRLTSLFETDSKAEAVGLSIKIAEIIVTNVKIGSKIVIESSDGSKEYLKIDGI